MPVTTLDMENLADQTTRRALAGLSLSVAKCKKIVVVTGAGISCSCGIPDFRSSDGLYNLVKEQYPDVVLKGRDLFDASLFRDPTSTAVFYTFIAGLKESIDGATPSATHRFIKTLDAKKKLVRSYTQNIDGLEERVGLVGTSSYGASASATSSAGSGSSSAATSASSTPVASGSGLNSPNAGPSSSQGGKNAFGGKRKLKAREVKNVQLHGDIHRVRCTFCSMEMPCTQEHLAAFKTGTPPPCPECTLRSEARVARSARPLKVGTLRPAIVLYDEPHPLGDDIGSIQSMDLTRKPDMLIIMGTSLKVHGFKKLVKEFAKVVHDSHPSPSPSSSSTITPAPEKGKQKQKQVHAGKVIFVNKTAPGSEWDGVIDYHVVGETDRWVEKVIEDWKKARPSDWEVQQTLDGIVDAGGSGVKVVKEITNVIEVKGKGKPGATIRKKDTDGDISMGPPPPPLHFPAPTSNPPSTSILHFPSAPSSPSKRRQSTSHYQHHPSSPSHSSSDLEFQHSPSKKRLHRPSISLLERREKENKKEFEGRGMLFGDTTNAADVRPVSSLGFSKTKGEGGDEEEDVFAFGLGLGDGVAGTTSASLKGKKSRAAAGGKGATTNSNMVEVVLDPLMDPSIAKIQGGGVKGVEKKSSSRARNDTRSTGKAAAGTTEGKAVRMRTRSLSALTPAKPFTRSTKRKLA